MTRRRRHVRLIVLAALLVAGGGVGEAGAQELTVSVAVSMKEAVEAIGRGFARGHPGVVLRYNLGASGELQKQIEAGAPVDVFVSAGRRQMDELERRGLLAAGTRRAVAGNTLVVVRPAGAPGALAGPADLAGAGIARIVIGDPRTAPAGQYAEQCLRALGLWERLQPRLVLAANVRQALEYVARGEVDAGFVYLTDLAGRRAGVVEAFRPPAGTYPPVVYPAAVVAGTRQPALARALVEALAGPGARAVLEPLGFGPAPAGTR